jgi:ABC-2 type transport system ATP-binding protein
VDGITFEIEPGEIVGFLGPNGAGKTTTLKMLSGLLYSSGGEARVLGFEPSRRQKDFLRQITLVMGNRNQLQWDLPALDSFELNRAIYRLPREDFVPLRDELIELLDIGDLVRKPVRNLSLGERMKVEIVGSLLHRPRVLFLDEPTIGLDLVAKARFRDLIVRINEERGTTILLTSHDVSDIEQVARRVIVINHGRLIYDDRVSVMRRALLGTKMLDVRFEQPPETVEVEGARLVKLTGAGAKLVVDTDRRPIRGVLDDLLDRYDVVDISVSDPPLEEIVSHIYARPL